MISHKNDAVLEAAARDIVKKIAAEGRAFLPRKPRKATSDTEKVALRELAHSVKQLGPLFDALASSIGTRADGSEPENARYKFGFLLRLMEATLDVAATTGAPRLRKLFEESGQAGGRNSGKTRRANREIWIEHVKTSAKAVRAKHPSYSQDRVVEQIEDNWPDKISRKGAGRSNLKKLISELEQLGELPKRRI